MYMATDPENSAYEYFQGGEVAQKVKAPAAKSKDLNSYLVQLQKRESLIILQLLVT